MSWWDKLKNKASQAYGAIDKNLAGGLLPGGADNTRNVTEVLIDSAMKNNPVLRFGRTGMQVAGRLLPEQLGPTADAAENAIRAVTGDNRNRPVSSFNPVTQERLADAIDRAYAEDPNIRKTDKDGYVATSYRHYNKNGGEHKNPIAYVTGEMWTKKNEDGSYSLKDNENYDFNAGANKNKPEYKQNLDQTTSDAILRGDVIAALSSIPDHIGWHTGAGQKGFNIGGTFRRPSEKTNVDFENVISETQSRPTPPAESPAMQAYEVAVGDTLTAIAAKHGLSIDEIARKNNITNVDNIGVGQQLKL